VPRAILEPNPANAKQLNQKGEQVLVLLMLKCYGT